jgi:cupin fold WbuC family metalloprotein
MVIAQTSGRYWRPKKHQTKIKSFNILEGQMAVVEFTESGDATKLTLLSIEARQLIVMAPSTFHTNAALTPICVHVETIQGPYHNGENDRVAAAFAPEEEDADAGRLFVSGVIERLSRESL